MAHLKCDVAADDGAGYIVSLGNVCRWLGGIAEGLGVEIYPGFAAAEVLYDSRGARCAAGVGIREGRHCRPASRISSAGWSFTRSTR